MNRSRCWSLLPSIRPWSAQTKGLVRRGALLSDKRGRIASDRPTGLVLRPLPPEPRSTSIMLLAIPILSVLGSTHSLPLLLTMHIRGCGAGGTGRGPITGHGESNRRHTKRQTTPSKPWVTTPDPSPLPQSPYKPTVTPRHALLLLLHNRRRRPRSHYIAYLRDVNVCFG